MFKPSVCDTHYFFFVLDLTFIYEYEIYVNNEKLIDPLHIESQKKIQVLEHTPPNEIYILKILLLSERKLSISWNEKVT